MDDLVNRIERLSPDQRRLFELRLKRMMAGAVAPPSPARAERRAPSADDCPLSFGQQRMWSYLRPGVPDSMRVIPAALRLTGRLDPAALERALETLAARHPALRAWFQREDDRLIQRFASCVSVPLPIVDLRELPADEREARGRQTAAEAASRPFDLGRRDPLLRALLVRLGDEDHLLTLSFHILVCDAQSRLIMMKELIAVYAAYAAGQPSPLPELPLEYADFIGEQRHWLQTPAAAAQLAYWKQHLVNMRPMELLEHQSRPPAKSFSGVRRPVSLPPRLVRQMRHVCEQDGVTVYLIVLAALAILLHHVSGQDDIVVSTTVSPRTLPGAELLVGNFTSLLLMRCDLSGDPTFREFLAHARAVALTAHAHRELPLMSILEALGLDPDEPPPPVNQVVLVVHYAHRLPTAPGLEVATVDIDLGKSEADLSIGLIEGAEGLRGVVEYGTDLFDETIASLVQEGLHSIVAGAMADPEQRLSTLVRGLPS